MKLYEWTVETALRGTQTSLVVAQTRKAAEEKVKRLEYEDVNFNVDWAGVPRIVGKRGSVEGV